MIVITFASNNVTFNIAKNFNVTFINKIIICNSISGYNIIY